MNSATPRSLTEPPFERVRCARVESLNVDFEEYVHRRTGARHFHLRAEDSNNAFMVALPTVPQDSTGVAHILEHTTLCGSERYPVRDPFFMMLRRSLNTFMNAFTSSDTTAYPFATQNRKDFDNLLAVYLDAVFFPRLDPLDFAQEGHRIEIDDDAPDGPLVYKGVVYNEMKGAMSAPVARLWHAVAGQLFPTTTYHWNSGGDPQVIPTLSYEQLKRFHARHYHPSNAIFFTYGDFPVEEHQRHIEQFALARFDARPIDVSIPDEHRYREPQRHELTYAVDADEGIEERTHVVIGWLLGRSNDVRAAMRARLLEAVLLQDSAAPLRLALETTQLGKAPSELCGLDDAAREAVFACGLEGAEPQRADAIEALVLDVLERVARDGVAQEDLEAALHQMELAQREVSSRYPYGLQLMQRMLPATVHGGDPLAELDVDGVLEELRGEIGQAGFVQNLVRALLLDNPHRVRVTMRPDPQCAAREQAEEQQRLAAIAASLDPAGREQIRARTRALAARQAQEDDPDVLPKVGLADVPADIRIATGVDRQLPAGRSTWYTAGTNGLVHEQLVVALPALDAEETGALALYWSFVSELGCGGADYLAMQARQTRTGHLSAQVSLRAATDNARRLSGFFVLGGEGLTRNHAALAELMRDTYTTLRFDELQRLRELVAQTRADAEAAVTGRGHSLAMLAATRGLSPVARLYHRWNGLEAVQTVKQLDKSLAGNGAQEAFAALLARVHAKLLGSPRELVIVSEAAPQDEIATALAQIWPAPGAADPGPFAPEWETARVTEAWSTSTQVNFCARAYPAVPADHPDAAAFAVLGHFLRDGILHRAIREQGGAYGGGAAYDSDSASLRFYSYRDPRLAETLADFDRALDWIQGKHPFRRVEEAILGVIKDLDQPSSPAGEALRAYFDQRHGRTREFRLRFRQRVLATTIEDLQRVAATYLLPARASTVVIGSRDSLDCAAQLGLTVRAL